MPLIDEKVLGRAAYLLLTSSSASLYADVAESLAEQSKLQEMLAQGGLSSSELLGHADSLWRAVLRSPKRGVAEFELAVILPVLARLPLDEVEDFLLRMAIHDRLGAAWVSHLSRKLLQARAANESYTLTAAPDSQPSIRRRSPDSRRFALKGAEGRFTATSSTKRVGTPRPLSIG